MKRIGFPRLIIKRYLNKHSISNNVSSSSSIILQQPNNNRNFSSTPSKIDNDNDDYNHFFQKKVQLFDQDKLKNHNISYEFDSKISLNKELNDIDNLKSIKSQIEILSFLEIFKSKYYTSKIYQSLMNEIINKSRGDSDDNGKQSELMLDQLIYHLFQIGFDRYDITSFQIELKLNWNKIQSTIISELIFFNQIYKNNINNSNNNNDNNNNDIILSVLKNNLEKNSNQFITINTISKVIQLLLLHNKYDLALKWSYEAIENYNIDKDFIYQHFKIYHLNKQNNNYMKMVEYWSNLIKGNNKIKKEPIDLIEQNKIIYQIEQEFKESNPINLIKELSGDGNSTTTQDEEIDKRLLSKDIDQLVKVLNQDYFKDGINPIIPKGEMLIRVSEFIRNKSTIYHGIWVNTVLPKSFKPLIYHLDKYDLILNDLESGIDIMVDETITKRESLQKLSQDPRILLCVLFGLLKLNQFKIASNVLQKLINTIYLSTNIDNNNNNNNNDTTTTSTTIKTIQEFNRFFKNYITPSKFSNELKYIQSGDYVRLLNNEYGLFIKFYKQLQPIERKLIPLPILNMVLSNLFARKEYEKFYNLFDSMVIKDETTLSILLELLSIQYPIPPIDNFLHWQNIKTHYLENQIPVVNFHDSLIQILKKNGNLNLISKLYNRNAFQNNIDKLSQYSLLALLQSFENDHKKQIEIFSSYQSCKTYNQSLINYLEKINSTIENQDIYKFLNTTKSSKTITNDESPVVFNSSDLLNQKTIKFFLKLLK